MHKKIVQHRNIKNIQLLVNFIQFLGCSNLDSYSKLDTFTVIFDIKSNFTSVLILTIYCTLSIASSNSLQSQLADKRNKVIFSKCLFESAYFESAFFESAYLESAFSEIYRCFIYLHRGTQSLEIRVHMTDFTRSKTCFKSI